MKKSCYSFIAFMISIFFAGGSPAYCAEQTPEEFVKEFYTWYIAKTLESNGNPEESDEIYNYVHPCTINKLKVENEKGIRDFEYFVTSQDFDPASDAVPVVGKSVKISETVSIVPAGYKDSVFPKGEPYFIVFVEKQKGRLRIIKVEGSHPDG